MHCAVVMRMLLVWMNSGRWLLDVAEFRVSVLGATECCEGFSD